MKKLKRSPDTAETEKDIDELELKIASKTDREGLIPRDKVRSASHFDVWVELIL